MISIASWSAISSSVDSSPQVGILPTGNSSNKNKGLQTVHIPTLPPKNCLYVTFLGYLFFSNHLAHFGGRNGEAKPGLVWEKAPKTLASITHYSWVLGIMATICRGTKLELYMHVGCLHVGYQELILQRIAGIACKAFTFFCALRRSWYLKSAPMGFFAIHCWTELYKSKFCISSCKPNGFIKPLSNLSFLAKPNVFFKREALEPQGFLGFRFGSRGQHEPQAWPWPPASHIQGNNECI